ncbi:MAG: ADP-ribosyltransferase domain-containing protein [archaeon]|nr:ADP-ribosyltransferase domain-containing protein [archaeon]
MCVSWFVRYTSGSVFYKKLNETLRNPIRAKLLPYYPYLQIFLSSLRKLRADPAKLPSKPLWRGINADLRSAFKLHSTVVWWGVSSCSMDPTVADGFSSGSSMAMVFEIHAQRAVAIASHSAFPTEQEYLLPPGSQLSVTEIRQPQKNRCHVILHELDDEFLIA